MQKTEKGYVKLNLQELNKFLQKWNEQCRPKGILLMGKTGHGKTTAMKSLNWDYKFPNNDIRNGFHDMRVLPQVYEKTSQLIAGDQLLRSMPSSMICFDDLGTERDANVYGVNTNLMELIVDQYKHASYTTNLTPDSLLKKYGERVFSRLKQQCFFVILDDKDFRDAELNIGINELL